MRFCSFQIRSGATVEFSFIAFPASPNSCRTSVRKTWLALEHLHPQMESLTVPMAIHLQNRVRMAFKKLLFCIWAITVLASCAATHEVASKSPLIQKRRYRNGWHMNLRTADGRNTAQLPHHSERSVPNVITPGSELQDEPPVITSAGMSIAGPDAPAVHSTKPASDRQPWSDLVGSASGQTLITVEDVTMERSVMLEGSAINAVGVSKDRNDQVNGFAIAGFILAFLFPPVGFILSIVALIRMGRHGGRGRGLAIAGIVISILMMLILIAASFGFWHGFLVPLSGH